MSDKGTLYLCATPIGNLEDITYRAVRMLGEADMIAAEDTRHTRKLLNHFNIHKPIVSYYEQNKHESGPKIIERLMSGEKVVLVSDAGMPGISDPGQELVRLCIDNSISIVPLPGANAALCGLIASGLDTELFLFIGFLPRTKQKCQELLLSIHTLPYTLVFYEAPHRVVKTLKMLFEGLGMRAAATCRELTKLHEEFVRGTLPELVEHFTVHAPRGEFTIVVEGSTGKSGTAIKKDDEPLEQAVYHYIAQGMEKKEALRRVAQERNISRRDVYQAFLRAEKKEVLQPL